MSEPADSELALLRREMDHQRQERLAELERRIDAMADGLALLSRQMETIINSQTQYAPTMDTLQTVMRGGVMIKWIIVLAVGTLAAISTGATAWEALQKWLR